MRALLFAAFAQSPSIIYNPLLSPDTYRCVDFIQDMGGDIHFIEEGVEILPIDRNRIPESITVNVGNSGILLRFITALLAPMSIKYTIIGDESICSQRKIQPLEDALNPFGFSINYHKKIGFAPFTVQGPIKTPGSLTVEGQDSQMVSALLMMGAVHGLNMDLKVEQPKEIPWVNMTLKWLEYLGVNAKSFIPTGSYYTLDQQDMYQGFEYQVPGDLSSLAFPLIGALITEGNIKINRVDMTDCQGDKRLVTFLKSLGELISYDSESKQLKVTGQKSRPNFLSTDIDDMIDVICALGIYCTQLNYPSIIYGISNARNKECDRVLALHEQLRKLGITSKIESSHMTIYPGPIFGAEIDSYQDHRLAMALVILALTIKEGDVIVSNIDCIDKTYPGFIKQLKKLGANIEVLKC